MARNVKKILVLQDAGTAAIAAALAFRGGPTDDPFYGFEETRAKKSGAARAAEREARERQRRDALYAEKGQQHDQ